MICPICETPNIRRESVTEKFEHNSKSVYIEDYVIHVCDGCREAIVDQETLERSGKILSEELP